MIPAHDRVRLTELERLEFDRMERGLLASSAGPTPVTLLTRGPARHGGRGREPGRAVAGIELP